MKWRVSATLLGICVLVSTLAISAESVPGPDPSADLDAFVSSLGLEESMRESFARTADATMQELDGLVAELRNSGASEQAINDVIPWFKKAVQELFKGLDTKAAARVYAAELQKRLSPELVKAMTEYGSTPNGRQTFRAIDEAADVMEQHLTNEIDKRMKVVFHEFIVKIKESNAREAEQRRSHKETSNAAPVQPPN